MRRIYLDHSATTPVDERVVVVMNEYNLLKFGNPSSIHSFGREARNALDEARESLAALLNCRPDEIYFTSGGTESDNLALLGFAEANRSKGDEVVVSNVEHPAVRHAAEELKRRGFRVVKVAADRYGEVHADAVAEVLTDRTILVSVMHANNEVGTVNDLAAIGAVCRSRGVAFHSDTVQSFGKLPLNLSDLPVDLAAVSSHKIYGPKGVGALFVRRGLQLHPLQFGGHQESGLRAGTENLAGIVGMGTAADLCRREMAAEAARLTELRDELFQTLCEDLDGVTLNGHPERRLPGHLSVSFQGVEGEALLMALDMEGVAVSTGSACSSGSAEPSPVLMAIGLSPEQAHSTLRITLGRGNTLNDIRYAGKVIVDAVNRLRAMAGSIAGVS